MWLEDNIILAGKIYYYHAFFGGYAYFWRAGDSGRGMTIKDTILGKQNSWVKAYNPQRKLPISKQTLSNVAEEIEHTVEVFSFDLFHDLYFFIIIKLTCETNFHKWNNKKLLLLQALKAANIQFLQISFSCLAWDPTVGAF
jgi:hypothetical protein